MSESIGDRALEFVQRDADEYFEIRFATLSEARRVVAAIQSIVEEPLGAAFRAGNLEARVLAGSSDAWPVAYFSRGARAAARLAGIRLPEFSEVVRLDSKRYASLLTLPHPAPELVQPIPARAREAAPEPMRVLIVEDHDDTARSLADLVEAWGYQPAIAPTGKAAGHLAQAFHPRVVLLDLGLPDESGYQVARKMRKDADQQALSFVVVTGWTQPVDQTQSMEAGISHHLVKPVNTEILRTILDGYRTAA